MIMESSPDFNVKKYNLATAMPPLPEDYPITAKMILDSISEAGHRLMTFEVEFPRFILAEFNTHRAVSKNASSSRAIPTLKVIAALEDNIVEPVRYGKNKPGMQADKENLEGADLEEAKQIWLDMARYNIQGCKRLAELKLHKQWASRPMEWFSTIRMVVSVTEIDNLFFLRDHFEAQDEFIYLAQALKIAANESTPRLLKPDDWHLPYVTDKDFDDLGLMDALKVSASRCARVSMKTHHGVTSTLQEDIDLFKKLVHPKVSEFEAEDNPFHASPTEHQATPTDKGFPSTLILCGNFVGWDQHRKYIEYDLIDHF